MTSWFPPISLSISQGKGGSEGGCSCSRPCGRAAISRRRLRGLSSFGASPGDRRKSNCVQADSTPLLPDGRSQVSRGLSRTQTMISWLIRALLVRLFTSVNCAPVVNGHHDPLLRQDRLCRHQVRRMRHGLPGVAENHGATSGDAEVYPISLRNMCQSFMR